MKDCARACDMGCGASLEVRETLHGLGAPQVVREEMPSHRAVPS